MAQDRSKKTLRHFQCRDYLWELFEQMSRELECSPDYLVNEAMRQYARSRNYVTGSAFKPRQERVHSENLSTRWNTSGAESAATGLPVALDPFESENQAVTSPPREHFVSESLAPNAPPSALRLSSLPPALREAGVPPPLQGNAASRPALTVLFEGQSYPIDKEEFLIGRGARSADLPIKDGNISRRHALVVLEDGAYHIRDLGSTNGIEFRGKRIAGKRIEDGDVFLLCDHELRFVFG